MKRVSHFFIWIGEHLLFLKEVISVGIRHPFERREFITQLQQIIVRSLPTTMTAGFFVGGLIVLQYYLQVKDYGGESVLGGLATSGTIREVGPLLIAFMLAGKIGAFTSAELGTMKVTYQMECIRALGTHPISYLIVPRYLAVVIGSLVLLCFGMFISVLGGLLSAWVVNNINPLQFLSTIPRFTSAASVGMAFIKALFFGLLMGQISCANGYWTTGGSVGVGESVKKTAVHSMVSITIADVLLTFFITSAFRWLGWFEA